MYKKIVILIMLMLMPINALAITKGTKVETVKFNKCVDGDTARFMRGSTEIKTRFLAVDTPETVDPRKEVEAYGKEASDFTCDKLKNAKKIELEYDPNSDEKDKYDRYLVWVYVDGALLQEELVQNGYAKVAYLYDDYLYTSKLQELEKTAKEEKKGLWGISDEDITDDQTPTEPDKKEKKTKGGLIDQILDFFAGLFDSLMKIIDDIVESML